MIDLLRARVARGSRAPHRDGASIALAVEGGAMRGVISAGMVSALEDLGLVDAFDAVYGSSAGAINAAYFLAGQARLGTTIYYEDINNAEFIDLARALSRAAHRRSRVPARRRRRPAQASRRRPRAGVAHAADGDRHRRRRAASARAAIRFATPRISSARCARARRCRSMAGGRTFVRRRGDISTPR